MNLSHEMIKLGQTYLSENGFDPGVIDGVPGRLTQRAYDKYLASLVNENHTVDAAQPARAKLPSAKTWPVDQYYSLVDFYGKPGASELVRMEFPYPMRIAWDMERTVTSTMVHRKVSDSLQRILHRIADHYDSFKDLQADGLDLFGGCYNFRRMRGGNQFSRHAWGIAIDLNPAENGLHTRRDKATMPEWVLDIFEAEGWKCGGRAWGRDFMHFQATS